MSDATKNPDHFRELASKARRLVRAGCDPITERQLLDFAIECDQEADALEGPPPGN